MKTSRTERALQEFHEEAAFGRAYDARLLRRLWEFVRPYRWLLWGALLLSGVGALAALARPLIMRFAIDEGALRGNPAELLRGGLWLAAVLVVEQVLGFLQMYALQVVGARSMADMRSAVFRFLHTLRLRFFDRQPVGRLVTRVTNDVDAILELFASGALNAAGDLLRLGGIVVLMFLLHPRLALVAFVSMPLVAVLVAVVRRRQRFAFRDIRTKTARMNANLSEQVAGLGVIQAFGRQQAAAEEFDDINRAYRQATLRSIKYDAVQDAAIEMVASISLSLIIVALGYLPDVSFGTVVAFNAYLVQFFEPISALAQRYTLLQSAMAGAERVFALLDVEERDAPVVVEPAVSAAREAANGPEFEVELDHVSFAYQPGTPVLRGLSLGLRRGEKLALVGPTGSGKTTVTSLLLRLYDVDEGSVRVNGRDVRGLDRRALRRSFAVVPQDVFLFPGTIASNVAAGEEPDLDRVRDTLARMGALERFSARPGGLEAPVDEGGANYSAGERQLIAFARALYRDVGVLLLDEATASVDSETEAELQAALAELLRDRTALIIAHRLSTIRAADRIAVLHHGQLLEQGTHDELLEQGGLYARLHELQFLRDQAPTQ